MDKSAKKILWWYIGGIAALTSPWWVVIGYWMLVQPVAQDLELQGFSNSIRLPDGHQELSRSTKLGSKGRSGLLFEVHLNAKTSDPVALRQYIAQLQLRKNPGDPVEMVSSDMVPAWGSGNIQPGQYEITIVKSRESRGLEVD